MTSVLLGVAVALLVVLVVAVLVLLRTVLRRAPGVDPELQRLRDRADAELEQRQVAVAQREQQVALERDRLAVESARQGTERSRQASEAARMSLRCRSIAASSSRSCVTAPATRSWASRNVCTALDELRSAALLLDIGYSPGAEMVAGSGALALPAG